MTSVLLRTNISRPEEGRLLVVEEARISPGEETRDKQKDAEDVGYEKRGLVRAEGAVAGREPRVVCVAEKRHVGQAHKVAKGMAGDGGGEMAGPHEKKGRVDAENGGEGELQHDLGQRDREWLVLVDDAALEVVEVRDAEDEGRDADGYGERELRRRYTRTELKRTRASRKSGTTQARKTISSDTGPTIKFRNVAHGAHGQPPIPSW